MDENKENLETGNQEQEVEKITMTQAELDALIQSKSDARVAQALKTVEKKNAAKVREAEKLAQMSATEKYEYELQQRELAIEEKERELAMAENKAEASKILADKGLDLSLVDLIVSDSADTMNANIQLLDKAFKLSVKAEVERRLAGSTPKKGLPREQTITREDFLKMSYTELMELKQNNPELYESFTK